MSRSQSFNFNNLTVRVVIAIILGIIVGYVFPEFGAQLKVLADIFIKLIKMVIAPIIFLTVVIGIGSMGDLKKVGRIGGKALLFNLHYFLPLFHVCQRLHSSVKFYRIIDKI